MKSIQLLAGLMCCMVAVNLTAGEDKAQCEGKACCSEKHATGLTKVTYQIESAVCEESCAEVDKTLAKVDGITKAATCPESKKTTITFDGQKMDAKKLLASLKNAGLQVKSQFVSFDVDGMACGACSTKVSKALAKVSGVQSQEVCHESNNATVAFDPNQTSEQQLVAAIDSTGFKAKVHTDSETPVSAN